MPLYLLECELCRRAYIGRAATYSGYSSSALRISPKLNQLQRRLDPGAENKYIIMIADAQRVQGTTDGCGQKSGW